MSATDELRAMLDERGVEHWDNEEYTLWDLNDYDWYDFAARGDVFGTLNVHMHRRTPEQAIEATLGRGECHNVGYYIDSTRFKCSECGWNGWAKNAATGDELPSYCPNCGRKVKP